MKTQFSLLVKPESIGAKYARSMNPLAGGGFALFTNPGILMVLDGQQQKLKPNKKPYVFDIAPGQHELQLVDPEKKSKQIGKKFTAGAVAGMFGLATGGFDYGLTNAFVFGNAAADSCFNTVREDGTLVFTIGEGDILKLCCQAKNDGTVQILPAQE